MPLDDNLPYFVTKIPDMGELPSAPNMAPMFYHLQRDHESAVEYAVRMMNIAYERGYRAAEQEIRETLLATGFDLNAKNRDSEG